MRVQTLLIAASLTVVSAVSRGTETAPEPLQRFYEEALAHSPSYEQLVDLVNRYPGRLAGSQAMDGAMKWAEETLRKTGCNDVRVQPVAVPSWERGGPESVGLVGVGGAPFEPLAAVGLGWSVATPETGLQAEVVEVQSLQELEKLGRAAVEGKIVFFNRPMPRTIVDPSAAYRRTSDQRNRGPAAAARLGAVGALTRSLTQSTDDVPHAGYTGFPAGGPKIPAAALSVIAADHLSAALRQDPHRPVRMTLHGRWVGDRPSGNVIAEIRGSEFPDEVIVVGAHLDCWDTSPGAHDNGAGVVQAIEVMRLFRALGIRPRHTLRCVLFVAEENSLAGGNEYARVAKEKKEKHVFAIESDSGGFGCRAFALSNKSFPAHERAARWSSRFAPFGVVSFTNVGAGGDIEPLEELGVTIAEIRPESARYFDYHHTPIDTADKVNPRELELGAAAMASLVWLVDSEGL
ncbi:peptidase M28 family protein [Opitutaceae bacterium EW11]|nr:peptidase M28 family protein [Opitutaceae bacterium EW11]